MEKNKSGSSKKAHKAILHTYESSSFFSVSMVRGARHKVLVPIMKMIILGCLALSIIFSLVSLSYVYSRPYRQVLLTTPNGIVHCTKYGVYHGKDDSAKMTDKEMRVCKSLEYDVVGRAKM